jgi:hypothetical protein
MEATDEVVVRRQWNDWRAAGYRLEDVLDIHWDVMSGGIRQRAPRRFLYAYVDCAAMIDGEIAHSGIHGPCPHQIKVCILKKDNDPRVFKLLVERAGGQ